MARDADAPALPQARVTPSLTAELIFAANLVASAAPPRSAYEEDWVERQRSQMSPAAVAVLPQLQGFWWPTMGIIDFLCYNAAFDDPGVFLEEVAKVPIEQFVEVMFNADLTRDQVTRLLASPEEAFALDVPFCQFSSSDAESRLAIFRDPEGHRQRLIELIRGSDTPLFRETWVDWSKASRPSVRLIELALVGQDPFTVAESLRKKPAHGPRQFERFLFIPSRLMGHRHIRSWGAGTYLFFVQEGGIEFSAPNQTGNELAEYLKVLGDKTRMDILRLLSVNPSYGKEIAASLNLTTATVSRHLDQLKAAGMVQEDRADAHNVKRVRYVPESLETQLERLKTYLLHS